MNPLQKTQATADEAWEKVRLTGSVQQGLEAECGQLRREYDLCQQEQAALLATCALLCGTLYPLYTRQLALAAEVRLLTDQLTQFDTYKQEIQNLVNDMAASGSGTETDPETEMSRKSNVGLCRFRVAAVAVMAANRLVNLSQGNCRMFAAHDALPCLYSTVVCSGNVDSVSRTFTGQC